MLAATHYMGLTGIIQSAFVYHPSLLYFSPTKTSHKLCDIVQKQVADVEVGQASFSTD